MEARRGNHDKARELFEKGIEIDQKHAPIFHAWATMEAQLGEYNRSILLLSRLLHCLSTPRRQTAPQRVHSAHVLCGGH
jgi:Tfp pilus assembly protein PilF